MRLGHFLGLLAGTAAFAAVAHADAPKTPQEIKKALRQKLREEQKKKDELAEKAAADTAAAEQLAADKLAAHKRAAAAKAAAVKAAAAKAAAGPKDPAAVAKLIDQHVGAKLTEAGLTASPLCTDAEFLRRAYLDLTGVIPSAEKARAFLDSTAPDKRAKLIDELLSDPNFGRHLTDIWQAKLTTRDSANRFVERQVFLDWLAAEFNGNTPWNEFVGKIVAATGPVKDNPAVTYFLMNRSVDKITDGVTQHFLGVQLQCAQCHNHPFTDWKQTEYWGVAAFFSKVVPQNPKNTNQKGGDNLDIGVREGPAKTKAKDFFPEATKDVPPKFLGGDQPPLDAKEPFRPALAAWMTSPDNPFLAKAMVNRTWAQLFGAGFVNPVDDMHDDNPASHPELLAALSAEFARTGFDTKHLYRSICLSQTYQRSSKPTAGNDTDEELFSHQAMKVMTGEQLFDSLGKVTGAAALAAEKAKKAGATKNGPSGPRDQFVLFYLGGAEFANTTEYDAGIPQALRLMNSPRFSGNAASVKALAPTGAKPAQVIESIYLAALSRRPTAAETERLTAYVSRAATANEGYADVLWAVLNSSEFTMVR